MVVYTVSYPPRLIPVSLVLPSLDDQPANAPGPAPMAAPAASSLNQVVKVLTRFPAYLMCICSSSECSMAAVLLADCACCQRSCPIIAAIVQDSEGLQYFP